MFTDAAIGIVASRACPRPWSFDEQAETPKTFTEQLPLIS